jgi:putative tricarboxylic transport membrane protein
MRRDHVCAALGLAIAIAVWFAADALPVSMLSDNVGAGGVPKGIAVLLALLSVLVAFSKPRAVEKQNHLKALGIAGLGFLYLAIAPFAGYVISVTALAGSAALYYGAPPRRGVVAFALGTAAVLWLLFGFLLGIGLP